MPQENPARFSARALQELSAADYEYARQVKDDTGDSVRQRIYAQGHAAMVAEEARAAFDRYLVQTAD